MDIEVFIEGVPDTSVSKRIRRSLQQVCRNVDRTGQWSVLLSPSETRGQWDLGLRGPVGHHFVSFTTEIDQLPALVGDQLKACF
jgi:hypothetical protein